MGCGASASGRKRIQEELDQQRRQLRVQHDRLKDKSEELHRARSTSEELLEAQSKIQPAREELVLELQEAQLQHEEALMNLRAESFAEHEAAVDAKLAEMQHERDSVLGQHQWVLQSSLARSSALGDVGVVETHTSDSHAELLSQEGQRAVSARQQLLSLRGELQRLAIERRDETEALTQVQADRQEHRQAESAARAAQLSGQASLSAKEDALRAEVRSLQRELAQVVYKVGQRDHELRLKNAEVQEVRQCLSGIEGEMDDVNLRLQEQYASVHQVEKTLKASKEIGPKLQAMRSMLQESHGALSQLCSLLENERAQRQQCVQGLKQQRVRTKLLLQLLRHFKGRTHELSPTRLLSSQATTAVQVETEP